MYTAKRHEWSLLVWMNLPPQVKVIASGRDKSCTIRESRNKLFSGQLSDIPCVQTRTRTHTHTHTFIYKDNKPVSKTPGSSFRSARCAEALAASTLRDAILPLESSSDFFRFDCASSATQIMCKLAKT